MKKCKLCSTPTDILVNIKHKPTPICQDCLGEVNTFILNQKPKNLFGEVESGNRQPTLAVFLRNAEEVCLKLNMKFDDYKFSIESKYNDWDSRGWKDGHNEKIINWRAKFNLVLPHLKPMQVPVNNKRMSTPVVIKRNYEAQK